MVDKHDFNATTSQQESTGKYLKTRWIAVGIVCILVTTVIGGVIVVISFVYPAFAGIAGLASIALVLVLQVVKIGAESFADKPMKGLADKALPILSLIQAILAAAVAGVALLGITGQIDIAPSQEGTAFECRPAADQSGEFTCHPIKNEP